MQRRKVTMIRRTNIIYENRMWRGNKVCCDFFWSINWSDNRMGSNSWGDRAFSSSFSKKNSV